MYINGCIKRKGLTHTNPNLIHYRLITRTRRLQSSFEKLEKSVGVELDLLGKEKPKNALNDDSPCPAMVISKKMSISLVKLFLRRTSCSHGSA
jgi:hypothetical protein